MTMAAPLAATRSRLGLGQVALVALASLVVVARGDVLARAEASLKGLVSRARGCDVSRGLIHACHAMQDLVCCL